MAMTSTTKTLSCGCSGGFECKEAVRRWTRVNDEYREAGCTTRYYNLIAEYNSHKQEQDPVNKP